MHKPAQWILLAFFTVSLFVMSGSGSVQAQSPLDDMVLITEDYPPFNYEQDGKLKGISTEIMAELLARTDSKKGVSAIKLMPWSRGYNLVQTRDMHGIYSTTRTQSREELFKWVGPLAPTIIGVIAKKDRGYKIDKVEDLAQLRIGVVKDDIGHLLLKEAKIPAEKIEPVLLNEQNFKKLFAGRVDAIAYETSVARWLIGNMGQVPDEYEMIYALQRSDLYLALHRSTPDATVKVLQDAMNTIASDGTKDKILQSYLSGSNN